MGETDHVPVRPSRPVRGVVRRLLRGRAAGVVPATPYWALAAWYRRTYTVRVPGYTTPLCPYATRWVPTTAVERLTGRSYPPWERRFASVGRVADGDWDRRPLDADPDRYPSVRLYGGDRLRDTVVYRSLRARFHDDRPWDDTRLVAILREELDAGRTLWHDCASMADVRERCRRLDDLYERLRTDGCRSRLAVARRRGTTPDPDAFARIVRNEIAVDVGRDGDLLLVDGRHRVAMAHLLGIDRLPVVVYVRHRQWMDHRENDDSAHLGHPAAASDDRRSRR